MKRGHGFTLIELVITVAIIAILASAAMPLLQMSVQRSKESELRDDLRQLREAIDAYKAAYDEGRIENNIDKTGYPPNLDVLVAGVEDSKDPAKRKLKFLRRIPIDPMQINADASVEPVPTWGLRSYASDASSPQAGEDVYDVYSLSALTGSNGVPYAKW